MIFAKIILMLVEGPYGVEMQGQLEMLKNSAGTSYDGE
jgi:hypothetical protein